MIENASLRDVERELNRLRAGSAEDGEPTQRTSVMTHMAWVPERWVGAATEVLAGLGERLPSRAILLLPRPDDPRDALDAEVDLRCFVRGSQAGAVCFEVIELRLCGARATRPGSVVAPLILPDLPVFLRWRGPLPFGGPELEQLVAQADRLIVDSGEWTDVEEDLARLPELFGRIVVSDIAWARTEPWRAGVAGLWPDIADASSVRVAGPRADALLIAHWLSSRLGREVELEHEPAGEIELVEVDGHAAESTQRGRLTASDLLSEQLELFERDRAYEEAVRSFSSVAT